jgi:hypothetical protein
MQDLSVPKKFPTIWFEGKRLPTHAYNIDLAAGKAGFPECTEALSEFWFVFTVCVGRFRDERASIMLEQSALLADVLVRHADEFVPRIEELWPHAPPNVVYADWKQTLQIISDECARRALCWWYGGYEGEGPYYCDPKLAPPLAEAEDAQLRRAGGDEWLLRLQADIRERRQPSPMAIRTR